MRDSKKGSAAWAAPPRKHKTLGVMFTALLLTLGLVSPAAADQPVIGGPAVGDDGKIYVCKYVGPPGTDAERLKSGKNPIHVSASTELNGANLEGTGVDPADLQFGDSWTDAQGRSAIANADGSCDGEVEETPDPEVTAVAPTVDQSDECEVEGSYTIPATTGVIYLLDGVEIAAGAYSGPAWGTVTAVAAEGYELTDDFSFDLDVTAAEDCDAAVVNNNAAVGEMICVVGADTARYVVNLDNNGQDNDGSASQTFVIAVGGEQVYSAVLAAGASETYTVTVDADDTALVVTAGGTELLATALDDCTEVLGNTECPDGATETVDGDCVYDAECPEGSEMVDGDCVYDAECPDDAEMNVDGDCVGEAQCPDGTRMNANGECLVDATVCPPGTLNAGQPLTEVDDCETAVAGVDKAPDSDDTDNGDDGDNSTVGERVVERTPANPVAQRVVAAQQLPRTGSDSMLALLVTALMALALGGTLLRGSSAKPAAAGRSRRDQVASTQNDASQAAGENDSTSTSAATGQARWSEPTSMRNTASRAGDENSAVRSAEAGRTRSTRPWTHGN